MYRGAEPVPGVAEVLAARAGRGDDVVYVTNNSMHYRADYVTRLSAMGCPVSADRVVSSARATALHIQRHGPGIHRVLAFGASGLERELRDVGLEVVTTGHAATRMHQEGIDGWTAAGAPDAVVTGLDPALTYLRLAAAADCIRAGARFIATNRDPVYPTERGLRPGAGSIAAALEATTRVTPLTSIGKPEPHLFEMAAEAVGRSPEDAIVIGDGIGTDLAGAQAVGARSVLMLTGITTPADVEALPHHERPDAVAATADELAAALDDLSDQQVRRRRRHTPAAPTMALSPAVSHPGRPARDVRGPHVELGAQVVAGRLVDECDVERMPVDRPQLGQRQPDLLGSAAYSSDSVRSETVRSSVLRRDRHALRIERPRGCSATDGTIPACQFEVGARSSVMPRAVSSAHRSLSSIAAAPWAMRSGSTTSARRTCAAPPHSPAWIVMRNPLARAASNERPWRSGSG